MHNPVQVPGAHRLALANRHTFLDILRNRSYENEQGVYITNGLSTELICFPSDLRSNREGLLKEKIRDAMSYCSAISDVPTINALEKIAPTNKLFNLSLGLYLYFADECSRRHSPITFLTAMRDANALLDKHTRYDRADLFARTKTALGLAGLSDKIPVLEEWYNYDSYTLDGERHWYDAKTKIMYGCYAILAEHINRQQEFVSVNKQISYALGNKRLISSMDTEHELLEHTRTMAMEESKPEVLKCVESGDRLRQFRLMQVILKTMPKSSLAPHSTPTINAIFSLLPDSVLELMCREGYTLAYSNDKNLERCYPKDDLPAQTKDMNTTTRTLSNGVREPRFRTIFLCRGVHGGVEYTDTQAQHAAAQTLLHETMHIAVTYLTPEEKKTLIDSVEQVSQEIKRSPNCREKTYTIDDGILAHIADYTFAPLYNLKAYTNPPDTRWEEVCCNLFAVNHGNYSFNGTSPFERAEGGLESLPLLVDKIEKSFALGLARSREKHPALPPGITQGRA